MPRHWVLSHGLSVSRTCNYISSDVHSLMYVYVGYRVCQVKDLYLYSSSEVLLWPHHTHCTQKVGAHACTPWSPGIRVCFPLHQTIPPAKLWSSQKRRWMALRRNDAPGLRRYSRALQPQTTCLLTLSGCFYWRGAPINNTSHPVVNIAPRRSDLLAIFNYSQASRLGASEHTATSAVRE